DEDEIVEAGAGRPRPARIEHALHLKRNTGDPNDLAHRIAVAEEVAARIGAEHCDARERLLVLAREEISRRETLAAHRGPVGGDAEYGRRNVLVAVAGVDFECIFDFDDIAV